MLLLADLVNSLFFDFTTILIILWAGLAGGISMICYRRFSKQEQLKAVTAEQQLAQQAVSEYDGDFGGVWPLMKRSLTLSLKRVWLSFGPSLVAGLPLILILFGLDYQLRHQWNVPAMIGESTVVVLTSEQGGPGLRRSVMNAKTHGLHADQPVEPHREEYLGFGPSWMRSWIFLFFVFSTASALVVRKVEGVL